MLIMKGHGLVIYGASKRQPEVMPGAAVLADYVTALSRLVERSAKATQGIADTKQVTAETKLKQIAQSVQAAREHARWLGGVHRKRLDAELATASAEDIAVTAATADYVAPMFDYNARRAEKVLSETAERMRTRVARGW
jgi:hypothetical protein